MSWLKAAGNYASGAMKAATSIVAPPSQRSTRSQLRDHVTYIRSFAESSEQDKTRDWDKHALTYRVPEELDSMLQLLEAENPYAHVMREDPSQGPCTMYFLEENVMDLLYSLMSLDHSVNLQKWVIKAVIRILRLRYELLDNGSIARLVLKMAERLEYSAKRLHFAIVHCEFLYTLCDKVQRNPWSLLPVMVSEGVNTAGMGKELLLLNWTVQHLQDPAGGEYAQRGVLLLLRIMDERVTLAACSHSSLIERTVRMVDSGFQIGMREVEGSEACMDEVGAVRGRPDPAQFYSAMRFVDSIIKVADPRITQALLDKLDAQFMRQTLAQRLLKGSEVQHVAVMEMLRGLFDPDAVALAQGSFTRRLQQPALTSMILRFIVGLPQVDLRNSEGESSRLCRGLLGTLIERIDSMYEDESVAVLQLFACITEMHDKQAQYTLIAEPLSRAPWYNSLEETAAACQSTGNASFDDIQERLVAISKTLCAIEEGGGDANAPDASAGAVLTSTDGDAYRRDAIRNVSTCFRCCELWAADGEVQKTDEDADPSFLDVLYRKLAAMFSNSFQVNVLVTGIFTRLAGYPDALQHTLFLDASFSDSLGAHTPTLLRTLERLTKDAVAKFAKLPRALTRLREIKARLSSEGGIKVLDKIDDVEEQKMTKFLLSVIVIHEFVQELSATVVAKRQCCQAWNLLGVGK